MPDIIPILVAEVLDWFIDASPQMKWDSFTPWIATVRLADEWAFEKEGIHGAFVEQLFCDDGLNDFLRWYERRPTRFGSRPSGATVNDRRMRICRLWRFIYCLSRRKKRDWCTIEPPSRWDVPVRKAPKRPCTSWTPKQIASILDHCDAAPVMPGWSTARWRFLILVAYDTGWRVGSLLKLRGEYLQGDLLYNPHKHDKAGKADVKRLSADTMHEYRQLAEVENLFPWHCGTTALRDGLRKILAAAGLSSGSRDMWHKFRRTHATELAIIQGAQAAARSLNHADIEAARTAIQHYIDPDRAVNIFDANTLPRPYDAAPVNNGPYPWLIDRPGQEKRPARPPIGPELRSLLPDIPSGSQDYGLVAY